MFCDFNIRYSPKHVDDKDFMTAGQRASAAMIHLGNIPVSIISSIVEIAKLIFFSVLAGLAFGQSDMLNSQVEVSARKLAFSVASTGLSVAGFFAPINATVWKRRLDSSLMNGYMDNTKYDRDERGFVLSLNVN